MRQEHNKAHVASAAATVATNATQTINFDTSHYETANVKVLCGTHATTSAIFSTLAFKEIDTLTTVASQSAIVPLTGGTATSSSVGFVIPAATVQAGGGVAVEFQLDLRKRKRYLSCSATPGQSLVFGMVADLTADRSADTTTEKTESNLSSTSVGSCAKIVTV